MAEEGIRKKNAIDVLQSNARTSVDMQKILKSISKMAMSADYFYSLTFEQQMILIQTLTGVKVSSERFIIDFFKATSKSPESLVNVIENMFVACNDAEQTPMLAATPGAVPTARVNALKSELLAELDKRNGIVRGVDDVQ